MNATDIKAAREALDNMDDYARMNTGVDAIGPRKVLEDFISMAEDFAVSVPAERAVSPAESVQSIDGAVFQGLLADYCDAYCALNGGEERTMDCMDSLLGYLNIKIAAAHAEGRRSAMEELAKEKGRADRAEAEIKAMHERGMKANAKIAKLTQDVIALEASRQAPDVYLPSIVKRLEAARKEMDDANSLRIAKAGVQSVINDIVGSLKRAAQPLQQEGGK